MAAPLRRPLTPLQVQTLVHRLERAQEHGVLGLTVGQWGAVLTVLFPEDYAEPPPCGCRSPALPGSPQRTAAVVRRGGAGLALFGADDAAVATDDRRGLVLVPTPRSRCGLEVRADVKGEVLQGSAGLVNLESPVSTPNGKFLWRVTLPDTLETCDVVANTKSEARTLARKRFGHRLPNGVRFEYLGPAPPPAPLETPR